jgi:hypothetical protein
MICRMCANVAEVNRIILDEATGSESFWIHPDDCGCPCMHKNPRQWEDMFSVERPNSADSSS